MPHSADSGATTAPTHSDSPKRMLWPLDSPRVSYSQITAATLKSFIQVLDRED